MQTVQSGPGAHGDGFWFSVAVGSFSAVAAILSAFGGYVVKTLKASDAQQWAKIDRMDEKIDVLAEKLDKLLGEHAVSSCNTTRRKR